MPAHVKGDAQWLEKGGIWNYYICDEDGGLWPVTFFNNDWWLLSVENGEAMSREDWRIPQGRYGLGWWTINDPQHPDHKQLELISPRDPKPEVPSDEEEEEFHPANPPRGIEVEESPVEETTPRTKTLMPRGWKPVTELESNILTAQTQEVLDISTRDFGWSRENIELQPRMAAAAGREAIRSRTATPEPLISSAAMGRTEGINPAFGDIGCYA